MRTVYLSDQKGNIKEKYVGYSFGFLFFGPFYLIAKIRFFSGIFLLLLYYYLLPLPGMSSLCDFIANSLDTQSGEIVERFLMFFRGEYSRYVGIGVVILFQLILSFFVEGYLMRRTVKRKKYLPVTEEDARLLISIHACNRKIPLASSRNSYDEATRFPNKIVDVPYMIGEWDQSEVSSFKQSEKRRKIEELNDLYNHSQMTREEYEIRRAEIVKNYR